MTDEAPGATGEHRTQLARPWQRDGVPDEVHAAGETLKNPRGRPTGDHATADAGDLQLLNGHQTQLAARDPLRNLVAPALPLPGPSVLISQCRRERDDLCHISTRRVLMCRVLDDASGFSAF